MNDAKPTSGWNEAKPYRPPETEPPVRSTDGLGDGGEHKCEVCGKVQLPLGWPTPRLCMECGRKRDMKEPKACPFCGINATRGCQENDGSKFWIYCVVCDAAGPKADLQDLAVWEWNKRKSPNDQAMRPEAI